MSEEGSTTCRPWSDIPFEALDNNLFDMHGRSSYNARHLCTSGGDELQESGLLTRSRQSTRRDVSLSAKLLPLIIRHLIVSTEITTIMNHSPLTHGKYKLDTNLWIRLHLHQRKIKV